VNRAAVARDRSGIASIGAGQHARQLAATGAKQTGDADHFAGMQREADVVQRAAAAETVRRVSSSRPGAWRRFGK
jgi:hypothetical protein